MNWDAIGATAEFLGAIGVIVNLFYLASQLRRNPRARGRNQSGSGGYHSRTLASTGSKSRACGSALKDPYRRDPLTSRGNPVSLF